MKIIAKTDKKKEVFKPIIVTLQITIESEAELKEIQNIARDHNQNRIDDIEYNDGDCTTLPLEIVSKIDEIL